ncbi:MAG: T9SS type A sorting domain-containing protein [Saprospiraceae bacterium]|nr:T9SS type A sorting domain-containing protein [Candidatus Brachybacter algidus]
MLSIQRDTLINGALSVNKEVRYKLSVNPNPAMNEILINNIPEGGQLSIFDIFGNRVMNIEILRTNRLDISNLSQGIYNVRYVDGIKTWESKLIVVK